MNREASEPEGLDTSREGLAASGAERPLRAGDHVDRYVVEGVAGRGGFAVVYRVRHRTLGSLHALKLLRRRADRGRLLEEGRIQARLRHPNLVPVTDVLEMDGRLGLLMEFVDGPNLREWARQARPDPREIERVFRCLVLGLQAAHTKGVIHRDLKPDNVLLVQTRGGLVPRVTDFGLARLLSDGAEEPGAIQGTPAYMAPEQCGGAEVDHRADLFSLGCVLYELLTGRPPFQADTVDEVFGMIRSGRYDASPLVTAPSHLSAIVQACLRVAPGARPQSCADLLDRLTEGASRTRPAPTLRHNLPPELDTFVGRRRELDQAAQLKSGELMTLTGTGGAGKTRLALRVAHEGLERWPGGVWFCDLSEARSSQAVAAAVALALNNPLGDHEPQRQLGLVLRSQGRALFVLDNFEQIVSEAAQTVGVWRQLAPQAGFLVTSREPLLLRGEQLLMVEPLPLPTSTATAEVRRSAAVELFALRARQTQPDFTVDDQNAAAVASLVALVDGLPLAIELAAARSRLYTPRQMLERMGRRFGLLRSRRRDGPERHATLRAAIAWSWELLEPWEQTVMGQTSLFEGGFSAEWAEAVVDLSPWPEAPDLEDVLEGLVHKSLLRTWTLTSRTGGRVEDETIRFSALVSIRAYVAETLIGDERRAAEIRYEDMMGRLGAAASLAALERHGGLERCWELTFALDDLRIACRRGLERSGPEAARRSARACLAAMEVSLLRGPFLESATMAERVLERPLADADRLPLLLQLGRTLRLAGDSERAEAVLREALVKTPGGDGTALNHLGLLLQDRGGLDEAERCLREALRRAQASGDRRRLGVAFGNLGRLLRARGDFAEAEQRYLEALEIHREIGNLNFEGITLSELGLLELQLGRRGTDRLHLEAALRSHRELGNRRSEGITLGFLGRLHLHRGQPEQALQMQRAALDLHRQVGNRRSDARALCEMGKAELSRGRHKEAGRWLGRAERLARDVGALVIEGEAVGLQGLAASRRRGDAAPSFERAEDLLERAGERWAFGWLLCWRIEHAAEFGDRDAALVLEVRCRGLADQMGLSPESPLLQWLDRHRGTG